MSEFKKSGGFGGNKSRGGFNNRGGSGRPSFGRSDSRDGERSQMYPATCDQCHKQCEVPFRPSGSKPVYCQDCFSTKRETTSDYPRKEKPPYQSRPRDDFHASLASSSQPKDNQIGDLKKQLDAVNVKIDRILQMMSGSTVPAAVKQAVVTKQPVEKVEIVKAPAAVKMAVSKVEAKPKKEDKKVVAKKKPVLKKK